MGWWGGEDGLLRRSEDGVLPRCAGVDADTRPLGAEVEILIGAAFCVCALTSESDVSPRQRAKWKSARPT